MIGSVGGSFGLGLSMHHRHGELLAVLQGDARAVVAQHLDLGRDRHPG